MFLRGWIIVSLLFLTQCALAQPAYYAFEHFGVEKGLSQNTIYATFQDQAGYMWIGTADGLNRFDGYNFKNFRNDPEDSTSIPGNEVRNVTADYRSRLWISTQKGLRIYNPINQGFYRFDGLGKVFDGVSRLVHSSGDNYWIFKSGVGLYCVHENISKYEFYPINEGFYSYDCNAFYENNGIYLLSQSRLFFFNLSTHKFQNILNAPPKYIFNSFCNDGSIIHICHNGGILSISKKTGLIIPSPFYDSALIGRFITSMHRDSKNQYWIGSYGNGLMLLNSNGHILAQYHIKPEYPHSINSELVTLIFEDKDQNIWVGTDGGGIDKVIGTKWIFKRIAVSELNSQNISDNFIRSIYYAHDSNLWVSTIRGMNVITPCGYIQNIAMPANNVSGYAPLIATSIIEDKENTLYIGTEKGLYYYKNKKFLFVKLTNNNENISAYKVLKIFKTKDKSVLVSISNRGMYQLINNDLVKINIPCANIISIGEDADGYIYVYDKVEGNHRYSSSFSHDFPFPRSIANSHVNDFIEASPGIMWMATSAGIEAYNVKKNITFKVTNVHSQAGSFIYNLAKDHFGNIWFASNKGLGLINPAKPLPIMYDMDDGLQSLEFNSSAFSAAPSGTFYWGGVRGINYFNPDSILYSKSNPHVVVTGFSINESPLILDSILNNNTINLDHHQNTLTFELASLDLTNPQKNQFSYKLSGVDKNEIYIGAQRVIRLVGLAPGKYTLKIRATNSSGIWSNHVLEYKILINPPFYLTWWFRTFILLSLLSIVFATTLYYRKQKYQRQILELERANEIENIRHRISRDIHDDIGSGLTRISILSEKIKSLTPVNEETMRILDRISSQSKEIINNLSEIVWTINPSNDTVNNLVSYLRYYSGNYLDHTTFSYSFDVSPDDFQAIINPDIRHNVLMVLKEALNNAVKYSGGNWIGIDIKISNNEFYLEIKDNGNGFCKGKVSGGGNGLISMRQRIEVLHGTFEIQSNGSGTVLIASVPLTFTTN